MSQGDTPITIVGNVVADPELKYTPSGVAVADFRVASTPRAFNKDSGQWEDQEGLFLTCNVWREPAENVMDTIAKGMRVIVTGTLRQRSYENRNGERRTVFQIEVDEVGPSLKFASAKVTRSQRGGGNRSADNGGNSGPGGWGGAQATGGGFANQGGNGPAAGGFPAEEEPPF